MKKIIFIDIGTHFGQEFSSLFGEDRRFYLFCIKRLIGFYFFKRGEKFTIKELFSIYQKRKLAKKNIEKFLFYFIEANSKIIGHCKIYKQAHTVFNCAITDDENKDFAKLYIANQNLLSQGSSIYKSKKNVNDNEYLLTLGISAENFFQKLKKHCDEIGCEYDIILRLNCEGVEDSIIYSAHSFFKERLVLILGSLKDVKFCKSEKAYDKLNKFIKDNNLNFVFFSPSAKSWLKAHTAIIDCIN